MKPLAPLSFGLFLSLLFTCSLAFADNVRTDLSSRPGADTFVAGSGTIIGYRITATSSDDTQAGCNVSDGTPATVTIQASPSVTVDPPTLTIASCNSLRTVRFSAAVPGDYAITATAEDSGGGTYNLDPAAFTLHVLPGAAPADTTPPVIRITSPIDGQRYEQGTSLTAEWSASDTGSLLTSATGSVASGTPIDTSLPGSGTLVITATDLAGNSSTATAHYDIVATPPPTTRTITFLPPLSRDRTRWLRAAMLPIRFAITGEQVSSADVRVSIDGELARSPFSHRSSLLQTDDGTFLFLATTRHLAPGTHEIRIEAKGASARHPLEIWQPPRHIDALLQRATVPPLSPLRSGSSEPFGLRPIFYLSSGHRPQGVSHELDRECPAAPPVTFSRCPRRFPTMDGS